MADTEMQGGRLTAEQAKLVEELAAAGVPLAEAAERLAADVARGAQMLCAWLERQGQVIAAALSSLPPGMAPATQASNVVAALLAAASTRPPAEERAAVLLVLDRLTHAADRYLQQSSESSEARKRELRQQLGDATEAGWDVIRPPGGETPMATHYPGDGHPGCEGTTEPASDRAEALRDLLDLTGKLLNDTTWYERGHPGVAARRTGWIEEFRLAAWRERFERARATLAGAPAPEADRG